MSVITATNLTRTFGPVTLFSGISFNLPPRARVAIVGPNGIGKTTLLRMLVGEEKPSEGAVHMARGARFGYLPQEASFSSKHTLWEESLEGVAVLRGQESTLAELEAQMAEHPGDEDLLARYGRLQEIFDRAGGYTYETRVKMVLTGLGFEESDYTLTLDKLSGGQRTRALLARLLLEAPDLLVLDEPTNHLDIEAVEWLESTLRDWEGAVLIVSHDRYFLDRVVTNIWEMNPSGFETYRGNYSHYLTQRRERWEERRQHVDSELARMGKELDYIKKNIASQRTQQAKGKLARLSREIRAIELYGFFAIRGKAWHEYGSSNMTRLMDPDEAGRRLNALTLPDNQMRAFKLDIRPKDRSGNIVLRAEDLTVGYPDKELFHLKGLELRRLECAALIGPNGAGKTTFLRTILGQLEPQAGEARLGAGLKIGYFAQAHEGLNPNVTLIEEIDQMGTGMLEKDIRNYLGRFLFHGEDHYKQVKVLSGGERGRLALAKLAKMDANLLLLDEPSNHLDIPAQEVLQQVLAEFNGTILMVSHDRYLIDALATQIWEIIPEEGRLEVFEGSYSEYKGYLDVASHKEETLPVPKQASVAEPKPHAVQLSKHERQRLQKQVDKLEDRILQIEEKLEAMSKKLSDPPTDPDELMKLGEDYAYLEAELEQAVNEWEELHQSLEIRE